MLGLLEVGIEEHHSITVTLDGESSKSSWKMYNMKSKTMQGCPKIVLKDLYERQSEREEKKGGKRRLSFTGSLLKWQ